MTSPTRKYRSAGLRPSVIGLSISHERQNLLARGLGIEHLRELLVRLARPILRQGASLAYAGHWRNTDDNFTYDLLRLISAEQEDNKIGGPDTQLQIGILYNHSAWPHYLDLSRSIEAQWINVSRIVRVTQQDAGIPQRHVVGDDAQARQDPRARVNAAVTLSAMRRLLLKPIATSIVDVPTRDVIPAVTARIFLGGRLTGFSGFLPGVFEEALATFEARRPLYILGGFGGATEVLAKAILRPSALPNELDASWLMEHTPALGTLLSEADSLGMPPNAPKLSNALKHLTDFLVSAQASPSAVLNTGLSDEETCELLETRSIPRAINLVRQGLVVKEGWHSLPS